MSGRRHRDGLGDSRRHIRKVKKLISSCKTTNNPVAVQDVIPLYEKPYRSLDKQHKFHATMGEKQRYEHRKTPLSGSKAVKAPSMCVHTDLPTLT